MNKNSNLTPSAKDALYYFSWDEQNLPGVSIRRILATYNSSPGDSGGIVYTSGSNGKAKVVGIHQGRMPENLKSKSLCLPAYHIARVPGANVHVGH